MYKVIINNESRDFRYEVWLLTFNRSLDEIKEGKWINSFQYLDDALSNAYHLNLGGRSEEVSKGDIDIMAEDSN